MHTPEPLPQVLWPAGQAQAEPAHDAPAAQAWPQLPQLFTSLVVLAQYAVAPLPQAVGVPAGQVDWHVPATQICPAVQAVPQAPQLSPSVKKLVQVALAPLPQALGAAAGQPHLPAEQVWSAGHAVPHAPQL
jgi:hypothetical protein